MLPHSLTLYITMKCPLKCAHCVFVANNRLNQSELDFDQILKILDDACKNKVYLVPIAGGDPLLHPRFFDIIDECFQRRLLPLPALTGTNITDDIAKKLIVHNVPSIQISLDGPNEEINSLYRGKGTFSLIISSIENLISNKIMTTVAICVDKGNYQFLPEMFKLLSVMGVNRIKLQRWVGTFHTQKMIIERQLLDYEHQWITEAVANFHQAIHRTDYIVEFESTSQKGKPGLVVHANGQYSLGETGSVIGCLMESLPSEAYDKHMGVEI